MVVVVVVVVAMPEYSTEGMATPEESNYNLSVDLSVAGDDEDAVSKVHMHAKDQIIRALRAFDEKKPPEDCEGHYVTPDWEATFEDD